MKKILVILMGCFIFGACTHEQEAQALYKEAVELKETQNYQKAIKKYKELTQKYPRSSVFTSAMNEMIFCEEEIEKLFSGYQNIEFGMSKEEVKKLFAGKLIRNKRDYLEYVKDKAEITFWFFNNALYQVVVEPNARKAERIGSKALEDIQNTITALALKYGNYQEKPNMVSSDGFIEIPIKYYRWSFKNREVILTHWDYSSGYSFIEIEGYQSLKIKYQDLSIKRQKEKADSEKKLQTQLQNIQQKQQELNGII